VEDAVVVVEIAEVGVRVAFDVVLVAADEYLDNNGLQRVDRLDEQLAVNRRTNRDAHDCGGRPLGAYADEPITNRIL
jgi:hypothetical protein